MKSKNPKAKKYPERAAHVPVTQRMLYLVRDELKSDIRAKDHSIESVRQSVTSLEQSVESVRHSVESVRHSVVALEEKMNSRFEKVMAEIHRLGLIIEEQNAKNNIVLDGLTNVLDRQSHLEARVSRLEQSR